MDSHKTDIIFEVRLSDLMLLSLGAAPDQGDMPAPLASLDDNNMTLDPKRGRMTVIMN